MMPIVPEVSTSRLFVVVNAKAGSSAPDQVRQQMTGRWSRADTDLEIHETAEGDDILEVVRLAVERGFDTIVAAGGDGTVSAVANGVLHSHACLGVIPLGTANVLARELSIPLGLPEACALLAGPHQLACIDAMRVDDKHYFTQIGIGVDAVMIRDTLTEHKKRLGVVAYLWTATLSLIGFRARRFSIVADGRRARPRALQVVLANSGTLGVSGLRWGPDVRVDDGQIDVCILRARTLLDFVSVAWSVIRGRHGKDRKIHYLTARQAVAVGTDRPLPVQGDGEVIGETPLEVRMVPRAVRVVVPVATSSYKVDNL
jgi:YegS/Rv2252/BmrU family lipid kinase